ncbi:MAG TPA: hypothetical protein VHO84_01665 [Syntrophorhabdaceae bacterium]|nr:hypothetical protein [Syntrophorhabdaceae bacterium]
MNETKECPFCTRQIKVMATVCRYCYSDLQDSTTRSKGNFSRIRVKTGGKTYVGDIFVPDDHRVSDVINSSRRFVVLTNAFEVQAARDILIGQLAINKERTERIEVTDQKRTLIDDRFTKMREHPAA